MIHSNQSIDNANVVHIELKYLNKPIRYITFSDILLLNHLTGLVRSSVHAHICRTHKKRPIVSKNFVDGRWVAVIKCCCLQLAEPIKNSLIK